MAIAQAVEKVGRCFELRRTFLLPQPKSTAHAESGNLTAAPSVSNFYLQRRAQAAQRALQVRWLPTRWHYSPHTALPRARARSQAQTQARTRMQTQVLVPPRTTMSANFRSDQTLLSQQLPQQWPLSIAAKAS